MQWSSNQRQVDIKRYLLPHTSNKSAEYRVHQRRQNQCHLSGKNWSTVNGLSAWTLPGFTRSRGGGINKKTPRHVISAVSSLLRRQIGEDSFNTNQSCNCLPLLSSGGEDKAKSICTHMHVCPKMHLCKWKRFSAGWNHVPNPVNVLQKSWLRTSLSQSNKSQNKKETIRRALRRCCKKSR